MADTLSDAYPVLLGPVRLEYRFTADHLLVRVFPDAWAVDTFEPGTTALEQEHARRYWSRRWQAGGDRAGQLAAWRDLASRVGDGRATYVAGVRRPRNPGDEPRRTGPDEIVLVVAGDNPLPVADRGAAAGYWRSVYRAGRDTAVLRTADTALTAAVGATRAARIRAHRPDGMRSEPATLDRSHADVLFAVADLPTPSADDTKAGSWTQPARARLLPDAFTLLGYAGGQVVLTVTGPAVPPDLPVGPDPAAPDHDQFRSTGAGLHVPGPLRWLVDFDAAVAAGMGFRIPLTDALRGGLDRLIVLGLRVRDPEASRIDLESLITRQAASRAGFRLLAQGTPTNNTGKPFEPAEAAPGPLKSDGQWFAELLGIDPAVLEPLPGANGTDQAEARAMNVALWPATWGYHLGTMLNPLVGTAALDATRAFFVDHVTGRGPVPPLRINDEPYGVLVTSAFSRLAWADTDPVAAHRRGLHAVLSVAGQDWAALTADVPFLGRDGDPHELLLGILGLHPASAEFYQRYAQGIEDYFNRLNLAGTGDLVVEMLTQLGGEQRIRALLSRFGYPAGAPDPDAATRLFVERQHALRGALVDDLPASETLPLRAYTDDGGNYLQWLAAGAAAAFETVRLETGFLGDQPPGAILYLLARHAVLNAYAEAALRLAASAHGLTEAEVVRSRREPPFVHISARAAGTESRYGRLYAPDEAITGDPQTLLVDHLTSALDQPALSDLADQLAALGTLAGVPTARLERALVEHLDCATYRLDAWKLGLATEKLFEQRYPAGAPAVTGVHIGSFGWLEEVRPRSAPLVPVTLSGELAELFTPAGSSPLTGDPANQGYIHAPSPAQASTAALLRAGYLANASPGNPGSLAVNLSSARVRTALSFLDGIRAGQSLGALLGYRLERGLHDDHDIAETDSFIGALREAFPLVAAKLSAIPPPDGTPIASLEARNVVDGLALVRYVTGPGAATTYPFGLDLMPPADAGQTTAIDHEVQALVEINDALADLSVAEGVHQAVVGNPDRAAAAMDALTRSGTPPDPAVVATPHTGQRLTHRIGLHLRPGLAPATSPVPGLAMTPRGAADPAVARWLADLLPAPATVACTVTWTDPVTRAGRSRVVTQTELGLQPIDLLWALRPADQAAMTDLDDRIVARVVRAENLRADTALMIHYADPVPGRTTLFQLSALTDTLRTLLLAARPARPGDLTVPASGDLLAPGGDDAVDLPRVRPQAVRDRLAALAAAVDAFAATLAAPLADPVAHRAQLLSGVDAFLTGYGDLVLTAGTLGLVRSGWGELLLWRRGRFTEVLAAVGVATDRMTAALADADALLARYAALPATATDDERFALLQPAERLLTTSPSTPRPPTPHDLLTTVGNRRTSFAGRLTALAALQRSTRTTLSGLLADVAVLLPLTAFDPVGLDLTAAGDAVVAFCADLFVRTAGLRDEAGQRLTAMDQALADYDRAADGPGRVAAGTAAIRAGLGPDALATSEFTLAAGVGQTLRTVLTADTLTRHLNRDFPVDDWLHGVARVRPRLAQWERLSLLAEALTTREPVLLPAQLPYSSGEPWLALELPPAGWTHLNPGSGLENDADFDASTSAVPARLATAGDFDGDGRDEVAVAFDTGSGFSVMDFDPATGRWASSTFDAGGPPSFAVAGDFDGDGRDELAVARSVGSVVSVLDLDPASGHWTSSAFNGGTQPKFAVAGDFDGDGRDEIAVARSTGTMFSVLDLDPASGRWTSSAFNGGTQPKFAVAGDFDGDGRDEIAIAPDAPAALGNQFRVLDFDPGTARWTASTFSCTVAGVAARFAVVGDFDGDGRDEIAICEDTTGTRGNDFWVMDYDPATGQWSHLTPGSGLANNADFDGSGDLTPARFAVAGDFDGDGRDEVAISENVLAAAGNDFWVQDYDPATGLWTHLGPATRGAGATPDFDCSPSGHAAAFGVAGDFDGDGRAEVAVAVDTAGTLGNDFWVMDYDPRPAAVTGDRLLWTAHYGVPFDPHAQQCALLLDEWTEVIPTTTSATAIATHYDRPGTQPPQTMLLVVPPARTGTWNFDDLVAAVGETLDLARIRAVEPQHIDGTAYAQLLPATVLSAAARPITVATDLSLNNDVPLARGPFRTTGS